MPRFAVPVLLRQPGPLRIVLVAVAAFLVVALVVTLAFRGSAEAPRAIEASRTPTMPPADPLPGGRNRNPALDELRVAEAARRAELAQRTGESTTPPFGAMGPHEPGAAPPDLAPERVIVVPPAPAGAASAPVMPASPPTEADVTAHQEAIKKLVASFRTKPLAMGTYEAPPRAEKAAAPAPLAGAAGPQPQLNPGAAASAQQQQRHGPVLVGAGYAVYGVVIQGGNSDQGSPPIVVEVLSGPIAGRRLTGSFNRPSVQNGSMPGLTVAMTSMTGRDGRPRPINAYLVSPTTMETEVMSRYDPRTAERVIAPLAAAFVAGLGNAIGMSGSVMSSGPYGGYSAFRQFTPQQMLGIAAGSAGQTAGQLLREQAPRQGTVYLDRDAEVAVRFVQPVEDDS